MDERKYDFGMIGLGTMGSNLLLNMADRGFAVIGFDINREKAREFEASANEKAIVKGVYELPQLVQQLNAPRKIMMLVPAGKPVDDVISNLLPHLQKDDILIDGGNSHFTDTLRRIYVLQEKGIHFMGMGISGGEMGARTGASIMPGGDEWAWQQVKPMLETVAARVGSEPCIAYMGKWAAGHYVKMVHNGIEYSLMQLISEVYDILKRGLKTGNDELAAIFKKWNEGELKSFLIEITASIFKMVDKETGHRLVDLILDRAGAKGTGKWTSQSAMDLSLPVPAIDIAVSMRDISIYKEQRTQAAELYQSEIKNFTGNKEEWLTQLYDAFYFATVISYAQGFSLLVKASAEMDMQIPLPDVIKIWRGGCIIRSALLEEFYNIYQSIPNLPNLLLDKKIAELLLKKESSIRKIIAAAVEMQIPVAGFSASLAYFDAYCSRQLPTNLIQAQRDYFGAHKYERIDKTGLFHNEWQPLPEHAEEQKPKHTP